LFPQEEVILSREFRFSTSEPLWESASLPPEPFHRGDGTVQTVSAGSQLAVSVGGRLFAETDTSAALNTGDLQALRNPVELLVKHLSKPQKIVALIL